MVFKKYNKESSTWEEIQGGNNIIHGGIRESTLFSLDSLKEFTDNINSGKIDLSRVKWLYLNNKQKQ